ncbi:MAG: M14 family zinc carboxypeptidase [Phycisphaerales bacterium]
MLAPRHFFAGALISLGTAAAPVLASGHDVATDGRHDTPNPAIKLAANPAQPAAPAASAASAAAPVALDGWSVVQIDIRDHEELDAILELGIDQWTHGHGHGPQEFCVSPAELEQLRAMGHDPLIVIPNVQVLIDAERTRLAAAAQADAPLGIDYFDDYRPIEEIEAFTDQMVADHPGISSKMQIGTSLEGRPISAITISGAGDPADKPAVVINAMQHAREWITTPTVLWFMNEILDAYGTVPRVTELLDQIELHVIYQVNPDGFVYSWETERLWRKNRRPNADGTFGVDLNRNWGFEWGGEGSSGNPDNDTYRGTAPFSEPETQTVRDFILDRPDTVAHIDVHSFSQLILWPFGYDFVEPGGLDGDAHRELAHCMSEAIEAVEGSFYRPQPASALYLAAGIATDWVFGGAGALSWTFELRPGSSQGGGFILPPEQIVGTGMENEQAFLELLEQVAGQISWNLPDGLPMTVAPSSAEPIRFRPIPLAGAELNGGTIRALVRTGGGDPLEVAMTEDAPDTYRLDLPPLACGSTVEIAVLIDSTDGTSYRWPDADPAAFAAIPVRERTILFADDGETDPGWTVVSDDLTDGAWERGVPAGEGQRGDPATDFDGSGRAWLTGNEFGNSDVDGGPTTMTSPTVDLSGAGDPWLNAALWITCDDGDDLLRTELSNDGGATWTEVSSLATQGPNWSRLAVRIADFMEPTAAMRVRFIISDNPNDSVTEAAVDAVAFVDISCSGGGSPDLDGSGSVDFSDLLIVLGAWGPCSGPCPADLDGNGDVGLTDVLSVLAAWG